MFPITRAHHHTRHTLMAGASAAALLALGAAGCTAESSQTDGASSVSASAPDVDEPAGGAPESSTTPATPPPSSPASTAPPTGEQGSASDGPHTGGIVRWCPTDALSASVRGLSPGAGNRYAALVITNTSGSTCRTQGWPGLQFVDGNGAHVPTDTVWDRTQSAHELTLRPGERAYSQLHWAVVPGEADDTTPCPTPGALRVIPPDQRTATQTTWSQGEVCGAGHIEAAAFREGTGPA